MTLTVERAGSTLTLPVLEGPSPAPPPSLSPPRPSDPAQPAGAGEGDPGADPRLAGGRAMSAPDPPTRWRVVRDVLEHRTEAEIDHGGRSEPPDGTVLVERHQETVGVALDRPGLSWARGSAA